MARSKSFLLLFSLCLMYKIHIDFLMLKILKSPDQFSIEDLCRILQ